MLVLDANIPIRGVLSKKLRLLTAQYQAAVRFYAPANGLSRSTGPRSRYRSGARGDIDQAR
jgi:hypothetical protein